MARTKCKLSIVLTPYLLIGGFAPFAKVPTVSASGRLFKFPETPQPVLDDPMFRGAAGDPVMLTEYISKGKIDEGRRASAVLVNETLTPALAPLNNQGRITFSGFITVNKLCDSNLFFWFAPAKVRLHGCCCCIC
jgi:hypothetical protein